MSQSPKLFLQKDAVKKVNQNVFDISHRFGSVRNYDSSQQIKEHSR